MATRLHDAAAWPRAVRQHIEAIAATLMLGLQVFRERAVSMGGSLAVFGVNAGRKLERVAEDRTAVQKRSTGWYVQPGR